MAISAPAEHARTHRPGAGPRGWARLVHPQCALQREAVAAIKKAGGGVRYNWEWQNGKPGSATGPWAPKWLVDRLGLDYFCRVTKVEIVGHETSDAEMNHIGNLPSVEYLRFYDVRTSDAGMANLAALHELRILVMLGPGVTDAALPGPAAHQPRSRSIYSIPASPTPASGTSRGSRACKSSRSAGTPRFPATAWFICEGSRACASSFSITCRSQTPSSHSCADSRTLNCCI